MSEYKIRGWPPTAEFVVDAVTSIETLEARIETLEAALRKINDFPYIGEKAAQQMALIARAALATEQKT
jgi:hypothetical protein